MKIEISRPKQYADGLRAYTIKIDGNKIAKIKPGESITVTVPEGASSMRANVDFGLSNEINLSELSSDSKLTVKNTFSHKLWIPFIGFYYATFARKKYLEFQVNG